MAIKEKKTKAQIAAAAAAGSRNKKKKWAKARRQEKIKKTVYFEPASYSSFKSEVPKMRVITPYILSEKFKLNLSIVRSALKELEQDGAIKRVSGTVGSLIYTRV
uniref:40S ribosomal protein S25 n=1 Tax=Dermatophagoides pteronyssinus TaxID=6956 RepID=A0A6P6YA88_DERPT|nr:40S ribosomal protein S25-3-like [Dermatophagoides pteronyssinus]